MKILIYSLQKLDLRPLGDNFSVQNILQNSLLSIRIYANGPNFFKNKNEFMGKNHSSIFRDLRKVRPLEYIESGAY